MDKNSVIARDESGFWTLNDVPDVVAIIQLMYEKFPDDGINKWRKDILSFVPEPVFLKAFLKYNQQKK